MGCIAFEKRHLHPYVVDHPLYFEEDRGPRSFVDVWGLADERRQVLPGRRVHPCAMGGIGKSAEHALRHAGQDQEGQSCARLFGDKLVIFCPQNHQSWHDRRRGVRHQKPSQDNFEKVQPLLFHRSVVGSWIGYCSIPQVSLVQPDKRLLRCRVLLKLVNPKLRFFPAFLGCGIDLVHVLLLPPCQSFRRLGVALGQKLGRHACRHSAATALNPHLSVEEIDVVIHLRRCGAAALGCCHCGRPVECIGRHGS